MVKPPLTPMKSFQKKYGVIGHGTMGPLTGPLGQCLMRMCPGISEGGKLQQMSTLAEHVGPYLWQIVAEKMAEIEWILWNITDKQW